MEASVRVRVMRVKRLDAGLLFNPYASYVLLYTLRHVH